MQNTMQYYTVIYLFDKSLKQVCLIHKNKSIYAGKLNGVGGKRALDETLLECAIRKTKEETGVDITDDLQHLHSTIFADSTELWTELWVGCAAVNKTDVKQMTDEELEWFNLDEIFSRRIDDNGLAGEGDVLSDIYASYLFLMNKRKQKEKSMNNILLIFAYKTDDNSKNCGYWQDFVIVEKADICDFATLEDSIASYMDSDISDGKEYSKMTEEIMDASGYPWHFLNAEAVNISQTHTFWI